MNSSLSLPPAPAPAPVRDPASNRRWQQLRERAAAPYRAAGRFAWQFARGKLQHDPAFRGLLERGDFGAGGRVVDIGCGQALLASLLREAEAQTAAGDWPAGWPAPPRLTAYTGIELMPRDVARARAALGQADLAGGQPPQLLCADMREAALPPCELVVILDVLHYVDHAAQDALLARVHAALQPGGRLLLRVGDQAARRGFRISQWVDIAVTWVRGHRAPPTYGRRLSQWQAQLQALGFAVQPVPMSAGTPFANVLLVAQR